MTEPSDGDRANLLCDEIARLLPALGDDVADAVEALESALESYVSAAAQYDACVHDWALGVPRVAVRTPRVVVERFRAPTVDGLSLRQLRPEARLAHLVGCAMAQLRAPVYVVADLQQLGDAAPDFVTSRRIP